MVLENCLPPELTEYDLNLPDSFEEHNEDNATGFDPSTKGYE